MTKFFKGVHKNFGFGMMRLPEDGAESGYDETKKMADAFMAAGFNYFDTAHGYLGGKSEIAVRECVVKRYPRDSFVLTNKLSTDYFRKEEDIRPYFEEQLRACGVDYFDVYLMHAQNASYYEKYKKCRAYETAFRLKEEGKVKHVGISFHDSADVLEKILTEYPQIETVQIQFNYADYDDAGIQGKACYDVCRKHGKPIIVMEPVKGGTLVNLPTEAKHILDGLHGGSAASYAIRYAAGFEGVEMVLSGMSNMAQMRDNISFMQNFVPLNGEEHAAIGKVKEILRGMQRIACTACRYCVDGCPKKISIPDLFADMNAKKQYEDWNSDWYYNVHTMSRGKASDCIACGKCEQSCPQHLPIRKLLKDVAAQFEPIEPIEE